MGTTTIGAPGTPYGPCLEDCRHKECAELRDIASAQCSICGSTIGYLRPFTEDHGGLAHSACVDDRDNHQAASRLVVAPCMRCGKPLGQGRSLERDAHGNLVHKKC